MSKGPSLCFVDTSLRQFCRSVAAMVSYFTRLELLPFCNFDYFILLNLFATIVSDIPMIVGMQVVGAKTSDSETKQCKLTD